MNAMKVRLQIYNTMHHHSLQVHEQFDHYTPSSYGISMFFGFLHRLDTADSAGTEEATKKLLQVYPGDLETCLSMELTMLP